MCLLLCATLCMPTFAQTISPRWEGANSVHCSLSFSGTTGVVAASITGGINVTSMQGTLKLYWGILKIKEWTINESDNTWNVLETFDAVSGRNYKLKLSAKVYTSDAVDDISDEYSAECP